MWGGILICEFPGRYSTFSIADPLIYEGIKKSLSTHEGAARYGFKAYWGRGNIPDDEVDRMSNHLQGLVARLNKGEKVDIDKELALDI